MDDSALQRVEQKRLELADNITKLRKSLHYWQTLEIDYEGLKEEIQLLPEDSTLDARLRAARDFKAEAVDETELQAIFCSAPSVARSTSNVVDLLTKRTDYVSRNIESIRKQVTEVEKKRNALLLAEEPDYRAEAALPLAEITEQLDEDGNVISSKVQTPGGEASHLVDVLEKAGVDGLREVDGTVTQTTRDTSRRSDSNNVETGPNTNSDLETQDLRPSEILTSTEASVTGRGRTNHTISKQPDARISNPIDTPEEAALRREMLNYGLDEVGAIVAELDMEDDASDVSYDEDDLAFDVEDDEEQDSESEDESGKSKGLNLSATYKRQMEELEKKLGLKDMKNIGPEPDLSGLGYPSPNRPTAAEAARKAAIARHDAALKDGKSQTPQHLGKASDRKQKKKKVAFAQSLDIADETSMPIAPATEKSKIPTPSILTIEEEVVERIPESHDAEDLPPAPVSMPSKKVSKFKSARAVMPQTPLLPPPMTLPPSNLKPTPEGPQGRIVADKLIENDSTIDNRPPIAPDEDDFNDQIQKQELAREYYRQRNIKIRQQGGFVHGGEDDNYGDDIAYHAVEDEETGQTRKISRFKAARIKS